MFERPQDRTRSAAVLLTSLALSALAQSCVSPTAPPAPPSGGHTLTLDYARFQSDVEPRLQRMGCDATGDCHGGGIRGTLQLSPPDAKDSAYDFAQVSLQTSTVAADSSAVLQQPLDLAAGGHPHPYKTFASRADSDYVAIRGWIQTGVLH